MGALRISADDANAWIEHQEEQKDARFLASIIQLSFLSKLATFCFEELLSCSLEMENLRGVAYRYRYTTHYLVRTTHYALRTTLQSNRFLRTVHTLPLFSSHAGPHSTSLIENCRGNRRPVFVCRMGKKSKHNKKNSGGPPRKGLAAAPTAAAPATATTSIIRFAG